MALARGDDDRNGGPISPLRSGRIWGMLESAPDGMLLADADGLILAVNRQVEELFGYDRAELLGRNVEVLIPERLRLGHQAHIDRFRAEPSVRSMSEASGLRARRKDASEFPVEISLSPLFDEAGQAVVASIRDVSERQRIGAEREAERLRLSTMEDRERIARDLHDLVIQRLFGAGLKLQAVIPEMGSGVAAERANETIDELDATIREIRSAIFALQRTDAERSLRDQVASMVEESVDWLGFCPDLVVDEELDQVDAVSGSQIVATIREALTNVARHADATTASVRIDVTSTNVTLVVRDDGNGIGLDRSNGRGLANMEHRAVELGGSFDLQPGDSGGTELTWTIMR